MHVLSSSDSATNRRRRLPLVRDRLRLIGAEVEQHARTAERLARRADVAAVQDEPVVRMRQEPLRNDAHELVLDFARSLAGSDPEAVGDAKDVRVDRYRRFAEGGVEHDVGALAADARQGLQRLAVARDLAAMFLDERPR